jgi:hypothetical protein
MVRFLQVLQNELINVIFAALHIFCLVNLFLSNRWNRSLCMRQYLQFIDFIHEDRKLLVILDSSRLIWIIAFTSHIIIICLELDLFPSIASPRSPMWTAISRWRDDRSVLAQVSDYMAQTIQEFNIWRTLKEVKFHYDISDKPRTFLWNQEKFRSE